MEKKILFLDFDGVLFDTLREVYLVNRFHYQNTPVYDAVDEDNYKLFYKFKYLIYNIWMFLYYNPLIFNKTEENQIPALFYDAISKRNIALEEKFCTEFLNIRNDLIINHNDFWQSLETPYKFFFGIKKLYENDKINVVIVSKKNKSSIVKRMHGFGFNLKEEYIFACEALEKYRSKAEFMEEYMKNHGYNSAIFVDDNENNIIPCEKNDKIKTIQALWGNTSPDAKGLNEKEALKEIEAYFKSR